MKESSKTNNKTKDKANGNGSGPMLKFNHVKRETLPQTRIDVRALEMVRGYPLYVKEHTDHEPPTRRGTRTVHHQHIERRCGFYRVARTPAARGTDRRTE